MALKKIQPERRRLADDVYQQLIDAIIRRDIRPGDQLIQEKLAAELQISRTPVREALMRLEQEGLLEVSTRGSYRLYRMTDQEVRELYQARAAIEGQAARILAARNSPDTNTELRQTVKLEESRDLDSALAYFKANKNIHRKFVELANNRYLLEMFDTIWGRATAFQLFAAIENVDLSQSMGGHLSLVDVIESGDKTATLELFTQHIQEGFDLQMKGLQSETS